jgi:hypothetical protein
LHTAGLARQVPEELTMGDDEFIAHFEAGTLPESRFHHADHVRLAWLYMQRFGLLEALARFAEGLKRLAAQYGKANRYHETITWAYFFLIHERLALASDPHSWQQFAQDNPDLLAWPNHILARYYRRETLLSDLARRVFILPERDR